MVIAEGGSNALQPRTRPHMGANGRKLAPSSRAKFGCHYAPALQKNPARAAIDLRTPVTLPARPKRRNTPESPLFASFPEPKADT